MHKRSGFFLHVSAVVRICIKLDDVDWKIVWLFCQIVIRCMSCKDMYSGICTTSIEPHHVHYIICTTFGQHHLYYIICTLSLHYCIICTWSFVRLYLYLIIRSVSFGLHHLYTCHQFVNITLCNIGSVWTVWPGLPDSSTRMVEWACLPSLPLIVSFLRSLVQIQHGHICISVVWW